MAGCAQASGHHGEQPSPDYGDLRCGRAGGPRPDPSRALSQPAVQHRPIQQAGQHGVRRAAPAPAPGMQTAKWPPGDRGFRSPTRQALGPCSHRRALAGDQHHQDQVTVLPPAGASSRSQPGPGRAARGTCGVAEVGQGARRPAAHPAAGRRRRAGPPAAAVPGRAAGPRTGPGPGSRRRCCAGCVLTVFSETESSPARRSALRQRAPPIWPDQSTIKARKKPARPPQSAGQSQRFPTLFNGMFQQVRKHIGALACGDSDQGKSLSSTSTFSRRT
jgi:hypothetical protein